MTTTTKHARHFLDVGSRYDVGLVPVLHCGWTYGDGSGHEGYHARDYFDAAGRYLGADPHGIEPLFDEPFEPLES